MVVVDAPVISKETLVYKCIQTTFHINSSIEKPYQCNAFIVQKGKPIALSLKYIDYRYIHLDADHFPGIVLPHGLFSKKFEVNVELYFVRNDPSYFKTTVTFCQETIKNKNHSLAFSLDLYLNYSRLNPETLYRSLVNLKIITKDSKGPILGKDALKILASSYVKDALLFVSSGQWSPKFGPVSQWAIYGIVAKVGNPDIERMAVGAIEDYVNKKLKEFGFIEYATGQSVVIRHANGL